jgi:hypothetical protein
LNCPAVSDSYRRAYRTITLFERVAIVATGAITCCRIYGGAQGIKPDTFAHAQVKRGAAFLAGIVRVERLAAWVRCSDSTIAVGEDITLVTRNAFACVLIDGSTQVILQSAYFTRIQKGRRKTLKTVAIRTELLAVFVCVEGLNTLTISLVETVTIVTRCAEAIGGIKSRTLSIHNLASGTIKPIASGTFSTAVASYDPTISNATTTDTDTINSYVITLHTANTVACLVGSLTELR